MNLESLEMYKFNKKMNFDTMCDSAKLTHTFELNRFNTLVEFYSIDFNDDYFVTCSVKKFGENYHRCVFWLKKKALVGDDIITDFDIKLTNNQKDKINFFKKNKKLKPVKINKWEDDNFIYFDLMVVSSSLFVKPTIELNNVECNVCYEVGKRYYIEKPFVCNHNEVCVDCINRIYKTSGVCTICRASFKNN